MAIVGQVYRNIFVNLPFLLKASAAPLLLVILIDMAATEGRIWSRGSYNRIADSSFGQWAILLLGESLFFLPFIAFVPVLIAFHRKIDDPEYTASWMPSFRRPASTYLRFGVLSVFYYFFPFGPALATALPVKNFVEPILIFAIAHFIGLTAASRMSLVYPAISIDERIGLIESWKITAANSMKVFCVFFVSTFPWILALLFCIALAYAPVFTNLSANPPILGGYISSSMRTAVFLTTPIFFFIALVFSSCASEIYRHLAKQTDVAEVF